MKSIVLKLDNDEFTIPCSREILDKIPANKTDLYNELISNHEYLVKSKVRKSTFTSFQQFFISGQPPVLDISNILEYHDLNEEFGILNKYFSSEESTQTINIAYLKNDQKNSAIDTKSIEEKIAENLDKYLAKNPNEMSQIQFNSLYNIFFNSKRKLDNQDEAYQFIIQNGSQNSEFYSLIRSLDITKMDKYQRDSIFQHREHLGFLPMNHEAYILKLEKQIKDLKTMGNRDEQEKASTNSDEQIMITIEYDNNEENRFNGLIQYLTDKYKDKPINQIIKVEATSIDRPNGLMPYEPENVLDLKKKCYYQSSCKKNPSITFDFGDLNISPTHYSIISSKFQSNYILTDWEIHGSIDLKTWKLLDKRENDSSLQGPGFSNTFNITLNENNQSFRYIKLLMTDVDSHGTYYLIFQSIEFFGTLRGSF